MKFLFSGLLFFMLGCAYSQTVSCDTIGIKSATDNIYNKKLFEDSLCSSFCIVIKKEVKAHKHVEHSEHVVVLSGKGTMQLNGKTVDIKQGDVVFIPKNTIHSVINSGKVPLKVISIQSPLFDGKDRVMIEQKQ